MLPVDRRGYPVPWFVQWFTADGEGCDVGEGEPEFRVMDERKIEFAIRYRRCWVCGGPTGLPGAEVAFVVGPMCAVNHNSAEPPSHPACADWSARACPFLTRPHMVRRENDMPGGAGEPSGIMLRRNPGVALVWASRNHRVVRFVSPVSRRPETLFDIGDPTSVTFYREGREATRAEVMESIESGVPTLLEFAEAQGRAAVVELRREVARAMELLPA